MHHSSFLKLALLLSVPMLLVGSSAHADDRRIVVMPFTGPSHAKVRTVVVRELLAAPGIEVVESATAVRQLKRNGWKLTRAGDRAALADELELGAIMTGRVTKSRGYEANVTLYDGDGEQLGTIKWRAKTLKALLRRMPPKAKTQLLRTVKQVPVPSPARGFDAPVREPVAAIASEPPREDSEEQEEPLRTMASSDDQEATPGLRAKVEPIAAPRPAGSRPLFKANVGPSLLSRSFSYSDVLPAGERSFNYDLPGAPLMTVAAEVHPLPWLGVRGTFTTVVGLSTSTHDGRRYDGSAVSWTLGAQAHAQLGSLEVGGRVQGGQQSFSLGIVKNREADGPDVAYTFLEPAVTARYQILPRLELAASAGFRFITHGGELTSSVYLSRVNIGGVNADAALAYRVAENWDIQLFAGLQRYFAEAAPEEGSALTRGGAVDVYRQVGLGIAWRLD